MTSSMIAGRHGRFGRGDAYINDCMCGVSHYGLELEAPRADAPAGVLGHVRCPVTDDDVDVYPATRQSQVRRFLLGLFVLTSCVLATTSCRVDRIVLAPADTVYVTRVDSVTVAHVDTLIVQRTDTVPGRIDTVKVSVPAHDTTTIVRVDTLLRVDTLPPVIVTRTDTLYLPGAMLHDSTWIYVQQQPTNPLGGGDPHAGLAWIDLPGGFGYALVFWHGNFVGVTSLNTHLESGRYVDVWSAFLYAPPGGPMPWRGDFPTKLEAIQALVPIGITVPSPSP